MYVFGRYNNNNNMSLYCTPDNAMLIAKLVQMLFIYMYIVLNDLRNKTVINVNVNFCLHYV